MAYDTELPRHVLVVHKLLKSVQSFCQGLERLKVITILKQNPDLMQLVFLYQSYEILTSDVLPSLVSKMMIYDWFVEYVKHE